MKIIRKPKVKELTGLSGSTIDRKAGNPEDDFPNCVRLGENSKGWYLEEIIAWIDSLPRGLGSPPPCVSQRLIKNQTEGSDLAVA